MTHRQRYLKKMKLDTNESYDLKQLSKISGVPKSILQEVYNRGIGAWKNSSPQFIRRKNEPTKRGGARSGLMSKEQWAYARVYSFLNKGTTYKTTDSDLAKKANY